MSAPDIWAVVPVKEIEGAKQRLSSCYAGSAARAGRSDGGGRARGARRACAALAGIVVCTVDPIAIRLAARCGARVLDRWGARRSHRRRDGGGRGCSRGKAAVGMLDRARRPSSPDVAEIAAVLEAHRPAPSFTIVPAHDARGSNAAPDVAAGGGAAPLRRRQLPAASRGGAAAGIEPRSTPPRDWHGRGPSG